MLDIGTNYCGYKVVRVDDENVSKLYENKDHNWFDLAENEYLLIEDENGTPVDRYKWQNGKYRPVFRKPLDSTTLGKVKAKNVEQEFAIDM